MCHDHVVTLISDFECLLPCSPPVRPTPSRVHASQVPPPVPGRHSQLTHHCPPQCLPGKVLVPVSRKYVSLMLPPTTAHLNVYQVNSLHRRHQAARLCDHMACCGSCCWTCYNRLASAGRLSLVAGGQVVQPVHVLFTSHSYVTHVTNTLAPAGLHRRCHEAPQLLDHCCQPEPRSRGT
jgi:hypothetical protein